jgi:hypothetical protein
MAQLSANDLKTGGIAAIESALAQQPEVVISVRGKGRFVVMELAHYHYLRECELEAALAQSQADVAAGRCIAESAQAHGARLESLLAAEVASSSASRPSGYAGTAPEERLATVLAAQEQPVGPTRGAKLGRRKA